MQHRVNVTTLEQEPAERLEMNAIGVLRIETSRPIYFDVHGEPYHRQLYPDRCGNQRDGGARG